MNKSELISHVAKVADVSHADAAKSVDAVFSGIAKSLKKRDPVRIIGFGTFLTRKRAARKGHNPHTGEAIKIKASTVPAFKAGEALRKAVK